MAMRALCPWGPAMGPRSIGRARTAITKKGPLVEATLAFLGKPKGKYCFKPRKDRLWRQGSFPP